MISIVLLGAGNVGTHFYKKFKVAGQVEILQWYNRSLSKLQEFKNEVDITDNLNEINPNADIYIAAISDDKIIHFSKEFPLENKLFVHTCGAVAVNELSNKNMRGVFYPLQSITKEAELDFANVPICIEALNKQHIELLSTLASSLGSTCYKVNSEQRAALHLAAVFVNNFTNQLYRIGHEITEYQSVEFDILKPLILETAKKIQKISPYMAQTGPAKRNDRKTLKRHHKILKKGIQTDIYDLITKSIKMTHGIPPRTPKKQ
ncbi:MAG: DUF2520 domain-containing protein [Flavobacteriaceae bacterium]|nr:DUF2520 domain-containing protein [Flavobacteriaceae bacterium]